MKYIVNYFVVIIKKKSFFILWLLFKKKFLLVFACFLSLKLKCLSFRFRFTKAFCSCFILRILMRPLNKRTLSSAGE